MGYHLIINQPDGSISSHYAETLDGLVEYSDISDSAIIYQGEAHWRPVMVGQDPQYKNLSNDWYRAGIKAQKLFKQQAIDHGLMVEELSQDAASFKAYTSSAKVNIKRGDYLLRNVRNIEVEVKCRSFINGKFKIKFLELMSLQNMQTYTGSPVYFAIYQRNGDKVKENTLCMIALNTIIDANAKNPMEYNKLTKELCIPLDLTTPRFGLIDAVRLEIETNLPLRLDFELGTSGV